MFASNILQPRYTGLDCESLTLHPSGMPIMPKRLRAATCRRIPERSSVPLKIHADHGDAENIFSWVWFCSVKVC